jgi:hypothetical protein
MCLRVSYMKKKEKNLICLASLQSLKKRVGSGVGSGAGSGSVSQSTDPHQNVTNPQRCPQSMKSIANEFEQVF